jgi:nucleoside-diphosphate-sugar epimerase
MRFVEWPDDSKRIDIGSFYTDSSKFERTVGWRPAVTLRAGLADTLDYYRERMDRYIDAAGGGPTS